MVDRRRCSVRCGERPTADAGGETTLIGDSDARPDSNRRRGVARHVVPDRRPRRRDGRPQRRPRVRAATGRRDGSGAGRAPRRDARLYTLVRRADEQTRVGLPAQRRHLRCPPIKPSWSRSTPTRADPSALLDGTAITAARTAACSALSARLLARDDSTLAILGTGVQARSHADAMCRVRRIREIRVAGRDPAKAAALAGELGRGSGTPTYGPRVLPRGGRRRGRRLRDHACRRTGRSAPVAAPGHAYHIRGLQPHRPGDRRRDGRRRARLRGIPRRRPGTVPHRQQRPADAHPPRRHHSRPRPRGTRRARRGTPGPAGRRGTRSPSTSPSVSRCRTPRQPRSSSPPHAHEESAGTSPWTDHRRWPGSADATVSVAASARWRRPGRGLR